VYPVPTVEELSGWSGRPVSSYTAYATAALTISTLMFTTLTEISDPATLSADDQTLAQYGILAYADYQYLRFPYQQAIAGPFTNETVGSYTYGKAESEMARNAAAAEVTGEATGVPLFDLAVRMLSLRTRAGGVFFGQIECFERTRDDDPAQLWWDDETGQRFVLGPADRDREPVPFVISGEMWPGDPGVG
jgi:hypothetical protein